MPRNALKEIAGNSRGQATFNISIKQATDIRKASLMRARKSTLPLIRDYPEPK